MASGGATVGALRVVLGADTASFDTGLKSAEKSLAKFNAQATKLGAAIGVGLGTAVVGFGIAIGKALDEADKLGKMSQSFGIPVEQLSALKLAADLSGVSIEEVGKSVGRLSRSMSEIAGGKSTGGAAEAFKALGISVKGADGQLKSSSVVLEEIADRFAGMADGAGKTALAISIFGRAGANMIPLLNAGAAGLKEAKEEAEALGLIIDSKTAKAAEAFNDNLTRLNKVVSGIALRVAAELSPALQLLTTQFVQYAKDGDIVGSVSKTITEGLQSIVVAAGAVSITFQRIGVEALAFAQLVTSALSFNLYGAAKAFNELRVAGAETDKQFADNRTRFQDFNEQARMLAENFANVAGGAKKVAAPVLESKNALDEFIKSQQKALAAQQAETMTVGLAAGARERLKIVMQAETIARENNIKMTAAQQIQVTTLANAMGAAALQQQGYNLLLETAEPHEKFRMEMERNNAALLSIKATSEQVAQVQQATAEKFGGTWEQVTSGAAGNFAALANEFGKKSSEMAIAGKALGIVEATINTYVAFTKALSSLPVPLNYVAAAGVLAAGLAKVAAIKSQTIPKMATGGIMRSSGFATGQDSQLLQARVRPDEQVEITRPGELGPLGGRGGATIVLQGESFTRKSVENLIDRINDVIGDRGGIKLATA